MGGLSHYLESEGLATAHISLIRYHTERIRPPRALWVPFELGRPLGVPDDAAFQTRVLTAALRMFEAPSGPLIVDYSEDAPPAKEEETEGMACPIPLPPPPANESIGDALRREIARLAPWHARAKEGGRRATFGVSGLSIEAVADHILAFLDGAEPPRARPGLSVGEMLKLACDDLKAYYVDAVTAQPGFGGNEASERWFWDETVAADVFRAVRERCVGGTDKTLQAMAGFYLVPRARLD